MQEDWLWVGRAKCQADKVEQARKSEMNQDGPVWDDLASSMLYTKASPEMPPAVTQFCNSAEPPPHSLPHLLLAQQQLQELAFLSLQVVPAAQIQHIQAAAPICCPECSLQASPCLWASSSSSLKQSSGVLSTKESLRRSYTKDAPDPGFPCCQTSGNLVTADAIFLWHLHRAII
ncbi:hypothetical protein DV515_00015229 [Chloebia gouldiae]|uniref:Uncharacterized protein n=1 Tax=Chloebia gouldiae TaxID=44316 RepID=A0A3L8RXH1_CHLGU|nr:hypothetical protein DV515_00015229 [Chloebia gouldiae]